MTFPYKLGALPAQRPVGLGLLTDYIAGSLPKPPPSVKAPTFNWGMLGNDEYGDCGVAGLEHGFEADALAADEHETWPDDQAATEYYLDYTGGEDTGVVLTQYLAYVRQHGYYGHTLRAFAPVAVHDVPTLQTAIFAYGFAYTGIAVTAGMQQAFQDVQPWDLGRVQRSRRGRPLCAAGGLRRQLPLRRDLGRRCSRSPTPPGTRSRARPTPASRASSWPGVATGAA